MQIMHHLLLELVWTICKYKINNKIAMLGFSGIKNVLKLAMLLRFTQKFLRMHGSESTEVEEALVEAWLQKADARQNTLDDNCKILLKHD